MSARAALRAVAVAAALAVPLAGADAVPARTGPPDVRLTVTFDRGNGVLRVAHLRCAGDRASADGYLRDVGARRACARARRVARLLTGRRDPRRACTQIYGGPERALVVGRIGRRRVRRTFTRTDGCGIAEWTGAQPLLPRPR